MGKTRKKKAREISGPDHLGAWNKLHRLESKCTTFQTSGGGRGREEGFNNEMEDAKGPIFDLTAAF